jgi:hypothetical protein
MASERKTWLGTLDPGIAPYVDWLDWKGIEPLSPAKAARDTR